VGALAGAWLLGIVLPLPWPGLDDGPAHIVGLGIGVAGILLFAWAALTLRRHGTTILPDKAADKLVTDGPYAFRRNPIYLADVLMLFGIGELTQNIWFVVLASAFVVLVTWLAILPEERHLEARFGDEFRNYKARTRRWI
jgi:protein-S-isoprenylcysteine O-methyltransferase Ste14